MQRARIGLIFLLLLSLVLLTTASAGAMPPLASALLEGRTYDQAHDTGYIDWSGAVQYFHIIHRDGSSLPPEEGGTFCTPSCAEWVTLLGNGAVVNGAFSQDVAYFEVMIAFAHDPSVGSAVLQACSSSAVGNLYLGPGSGLPGFISVVLDVPPGCRTWSLSASGGYVAFRSMDVVYAAAPPTPVDTATPMPSLTPPPTFTPTSTITLAPTSTYTPTATNTSTSTPPNTLTATRTATVTASPTDTMIPSRTPTNTLTPTSTYTLTPTHTATPTPTYTATFTPTYTATFTPTNTATFTPTHTATFTPTNTTTFTPTYTATFTPTNTATLTPTYTATFTPTYTATFTPTNTTTLTPTYTATFTPTYTATFTPTNTATPTPTHTASPTPTPLPPEITGQIVCDLWGDAAWCRGNESLELAASDPQGFEVSISGDLNGDLFTCGSSCSLSLPEGVGTAHYRVTSASGRIANESSTWQRDGTPPLLNMVLPSLDGRQGWYITEVDVSASASDAISGLYSISGSMDEGATWNSLPIHLTDGVQPVAIRAQDAAGNETMVSDVIHVDTAPPVSQFTSHTGGQVVQGNVPLSGKLEDETSGVDGGELSLDSAAWQPVSLEAGEVWSYSWNTMTLQNGPYSLQIRGTDQAGNLGDAAKITLFVDNTPPQVTLTDRWWIWEAGRLSVAPNYFPIASVQVTISDPQDRWPAVVLDFDPHDIPGSISWDRRFADGTLAPSGEYRVLARACDIHDRCGSDIGIIAIPFASTWTATLTPSPTATLTMTPQAISTSTQEPAIPTPLLATPSPEIPSEPDQPTRSLPLWQLVGLVGLFLAIASASVVDPRPAALDRLRESFDPLSNQDRVGPSKGNQ